MNQITLSPQVLQTYFFWLRQLDVDARKVLIEQLSASIREDTPTQKQPDSLFGAWEGNETAEEILVQIYANRHIERTIETF